MREYMKKRLLPMFGVALCVASIAASPASAATEPGVERITMSPTSSDYSVDAGKTINDKLTIINDGAVAYDFLVYARPYSVSSEAYEPNFTATPKNADLYAWVQFAQTKYHLEPGASTKINYTIRVPEGAAPGGHYGVIFVETQPSGQAATGSVLRKKRVGSIIYATVNGSYKNEGTANEVDIPFWQVQPPLHVSMKAKNTGNTDFIDTTRVVVKDVFGRVKHDATKDYVVLPQTTRKINSDWTGASWFGLYKVDVEQKVLGKTTASSGYVLMMPRYLPVALIVILLIGGLYAAYHRKKR